MDKITLSNTTYLIELKKLLAPEFDDTIFDFSKLDYAHRVEVFKYILNNVDITNKCLLINVINLIKNYNMLSDSFFAIENNLIKSIEEMVDIKTELSGQLSKYIDDFSSWYLSLFSSMHIICPTAFDNVEVIPQSFKQIIQMFDLYTLSAISAKHIVFHKHNVSNAYELIEQLVEKNCLANKVIANLMSDV